MDDARCRARSCAVMQPAEFACRVCDCRAYVAVGQSRKGAGFDACAGCSLVFTAPEKLSKPPHELVTPGFAHLFVGRPRDGCGAEPEHDPPIAEHPR